MAALAVPVPPALVLYVTNTGEELINLNELL